MSTPLRPAPDAPLARFAAAVAQVEDAAAAVLDAEDIPAAIAELERVRAGLWRRLSAPTPPEPVERLLTAREAAERLGVEVSALYRWKGGGPPFRVKVSPGRARYSSAGIDRYIRSRTGR